MPKKDLNIYKNYREGILENENEPEEGEIVDDCELIVSSDEELCMRQRIRELEAENEEIEQIAVISRCYVDEFKPLRSTLDERRAARIPTDASSISSTEFVTPKKHKRRKSKERKRKHCHRHHHQHQHHQTHHRHEQQQQELPQYNTIKTHSHTKKTQCKRRQKIIAKKQNKLHSDRYMYKEISHGTAYLYSPDSSDSSSSSLTDTESYSNSKHPQHSNRKDDAKNYDSFITRDTLRLAVARRSGDARFSTKKSCLKDKLLRQELVSHASNTFNNKRDIEEDVDDVIEVIEPEAEIQTVDEDSSENSTEEKELRLIALKSAVMKKHMARKRRNAELAYSPTDFDGQNKLNYIDVVDLEENDLQNGCVIVSPEASPQLMMLDDQDDSQLMMDCKPVDMDIVNSDSEDAAIDNWSKQTTSTMPTFWHASKEFAKQFQYNMHVHDIELPPPPPGVDDYEDFPPPPSYFRTHNTQMQDMELENEELMKEVAAIETTTNHFQDKEDKTLEANMETTCTSKIKQEIIEIEDQEDEEEEALRALLLSKFQSPKNQKKIEQEQKPIVSNDDKSKSNELESKEHLKMKPTESILKEAVKRLKVHTQTDSLNEDSCHSHEDIKHPTSKSNDGWEDQNDNDSMISLSALRKRLIKISSQQTQVIEREQIHMDVEDKPQICTVNNRESLEVKTETSDFSREKEDVKELPNISESNSNMVTNTVDISDITRRLQEIKNKILNSNIKPSLQENSGTLTKVEVNDSEPSLTAVPNVPKENDKETDTNNSILKNSVQNMMNHTDGDPKELTKHKIVKADFDASKKCTTFKVTISNSAALKTEDTLFKENDNEHGVVKTLFKENDNEHIGAKTLFKENANENVMKNKLNKVTSKEPTKTKQNSQLGIKKVLAIKTEDKMAKKSQPPLADTKTSTSNSTALPSYSVTRTTKIVKPNKVINTNMDLKRKLVTQSTDTTISSKSSKTEPLRQTTKSNDKNRSITSFDQVKHMCKIPQFVISVQNSSNESSEDDWVEAYDTLYKPLYDYNDIASPLSLNLESPCLTPTRSNSPIETNNKDIQFEEKLDTFLKTVRTTTVVVKEKTNELTPPSDQSSKTNKTPLAVRHLPAAAQSEYRRLIHRMKLLQNQRKTTEETENIGKPSTDTQANISQSEMLDKNNETEASTVNTAALKPSLVKQVLIRNTNNNNSTATDAQTNGQSDTQTSPKSHKTNVLRSYENIYVKIGAGIVNHLDKSLKLVEEAKKAKISKLKLESRLKELKSEMEALQSKHKEEQQKISRIYPNICSTNDVISTLKQKRAKVFKAALSLGKTLKGGEYRLNNELKESITTKTKKLATTIKLVNSLKAQDINNLEDILKKNNTDKEAIELENQAIVAEEEVQQVQEVQEEKMEETKSSTQEIKLKEEDPKMTKDDDDEAILPSAQHNLGGNIEFQKGEPPDNQPQDPVLGQLMDKEAAIEDTEKKPMCSYKSPLEHLRNMDSNMDPNGVVCPYDLMGNCEDASCKYVHISPNAPQTKLNII